jgi:DNA-binding CsgD family transcriptional regulator
MQMIARATARDGAFSGLAGFEQVILVRVAATAPLVTAAILRHHMGTATEQANCCSAQHNSIIGERFLQGPFSSLAERERSVCSGIVDGFISEAIALGISINSVLSYRKRAYSKLGNTSSNELFALSAHKVKAFYDVERVH